MKAIYPHDLPRAVSILRCENEAGCMELRTRYKDLACCTCGKIDEEQALQRGIDKDVRFVIRRDIFGSFEDLYIVNERGREVFDSFADANIAYYPIPSARGFWVAMPRFVVQPTSKDVAFRTSNPCKECGRFSSILWGSCAPKIPENVTIGAIHFENAHGVVPVIFGTDAVAERLAGVRPRLRTVVCLPLGLVTKASS